MNILTIEQIKRRGMAAVDDALRQGPVHLVKGKRPAAVVMSEDEYSRLAGQTAQHDAAAGRRTALEIFMSEDNAPGGLDAKGLAERIEEARGGWNER